MTIKEHFALASKIQYYQEYAFLHVRTATNMRNLNQENFFSSFVTIRYELTFYEAVVLCN